MGIHPPVVSLWSADGSSTASGGIVVQAEEDRAVVLAGQSDSLVEIDEAIRFPEHDDLKV